ncbi:hypothetical protein [Roseateles toxinivorans]|uniref:Uncharacterized protein n=1 Tax=Roseateles toxinivorans TaxID=270368 RepID=A0A4R6QDI2_9BURK|nr:hypothetical protein [Roseateles toxinivorans]TDP60445.1 hypothetical protein DES47_11645 [Roseateles toxinivorans]
MNRLTTSARRQEFPRPDQNASRLLTATATVRSLTLLPSGHVSCILQTPTGRLTVLSSAAMVHLPELHRSAQVQVVLLRVRRDTDGGTWHWQMLCCRALEEGKATVSPISAIPSPSAQTSTQTSLEGSRA